MPAAMMFPAESTPTELNVASPPIKEENNKVPALALMAATKGALLGGLPTA
jgi:hypothetical protein